MAMGGTPLPKLDQPCSFVLSTLELHVQPPPKAASAPSTYPTLCIFAQIAL